MSYSTFILPDPKKIEYVKLRLLENMVPNILESGLVKFTEEKSHFIPETRIQASLNIIPLEERRVEPSPLFTRGYYTPNIPKILDLLGALDGLFDDPEITRTIHEIKSLLYGL